MQREGVGEPGDPQHLRDPAGAGHQHERPGAAAKLLAGGYQGTQARRVQETDPAQVRDDVNGAVAGQVHHPLTELRGSAGVDVTVDPQHGAVTARCDGLQVKRPHPASVTCGLRSRPPGQLHRVPARTPQCGPGRLVARPASRAGRQYGGTPLHYDGRAAGAAVKAETRMAGDGMLPPGTAARSPTAVVSPTPERLTAPAKIAIGADCCPV